LQVLRLLAANLDGYFYLLKQLRFCHHVSSPVLSNSKMQQIRSIERPGYEAVDINLNYAEEDHEPLAPLLHRYV
jgi:hypothetical protein